MVPFLKQACSWSPMSAICVQSFDDSLSPAIHTRYRISLRSSSLREPRYPLLRVVFGFKSQRTTGAGCWTKADSGLALQASGIPSPIMPYQALTLSAQDTQVGLKQLDTLVIRTRFSGRRQKTKQLDTPAISTRDSFSLFKEAKSHPIPINRTEEAGRPGLCPVNPISSGLLYGTLRHPSRLHKICYKENNLQKIIKH